MSKRVAKDRQSGGENENYPTPSWCVDRLLERLPLPGYHWLEPACGHGTIVRAVRDRRHLDTVPIFVAVDPFVLPAVDVAAHWSESYLTWYPYSPPYDVAITNPPFSLAEQFARRMLTMADHVVLLLRLNWIGSAKRCDFFEDHPPSRILVLPDRPCFARSTKTGKPQSDSCEYAWFYWNTSEVPRATTIERLAVTPASERRESQKTA